MDGISSDGLRPAVKAFSCPRCGGIVELRAPGQSLSAVCTHCGSTLDVSDENFRVLSDMDSRVLHKPAIPLGTRGKIKGITWEVIGFMMRRVPEYDFRWSEYLLFNPIHGYRWLINISDHWSFVSPVTVPPASGANGAMIHDGRSYKYFTNGVAEVVFVLGEFYWRVEKGAKVQMSDFISPPFGLSKEQDAGEIVWSHSEYMEPREIEEAFKLGSKLPTPTTVAFNQVNKFAWLSSKMSIVMWVTLSILCITLFSSWMLAPHKVMHAQQFVVAYGKDSSLVSEPFEITGRLDNVEIHIDATLSNAWLEADGYLSNLETQKHYNFQLGTSYWHGTDIDGNWAEGSKVASHIISSVPSGKYQLTFHTVTGEDPILNPPRNCYMDVSVVRGVPFASNFLFFGLLVALPFLIVFVLKQRFEYKRKENA